MIGVFARAVAALAVCAFDATMTVMSARATATAATIALRGRRRGEGDDEVSNAARHDLPSRPTRKTRGRVSRPAMIGN